MKIFKPWLLVPLIICMAGLLVESITDYWIVHSIQNSSQPSPDEFADRIAMTADVVKWSHYSAWTGFICVIIGLAWNFWKERVEASPPDE